MLLLMDAPLSPMYFGVILLIHRDLGYISVLAGLALALIALINQKQLRSVWARPACMPRRPMRRPSCSHEIPR